MPACDLPDVFAPSLTCIKDQLMKARGPTHANAPLLFQLKTFPCTILTRKVLLKEFKAGLVAAGFENVSSYTLYSICAAVSSLRAYLPASRGRSLLNSADMRVMHGIATCSSYSPCSLIERHCWSFLQITKQQCLKLYFIGAKRHPY